MTTFTRRTLAGVTAALTSVTFAAASNSQAATSSVRSASRACSSSPTPAVPLQQRPRIVIMNDGEVDDMDSFIRYLYYSNEFDTAAIVLTSSIYHYAGNGTTVKPFRWTGTTWLPKYIDLYAKIYPNLKHHANGYPTPAQLKSLYHVGNIATTSDMAQPTDGSRAIEKVILDADTRPVYFQAWGGLNTLARALKSIEEKYHGTPQWPALQRKIAKKVVVYNILNQDATLKGYIQPHFPGIRIIDNSNQFWSFAYAWPMRTPTANQYVLKAPWMEQNLLDGTGPLMAQYRTYRDGKPTPGDDQNNRWRPDATEANQSVGYDVHDFISEGDSPAFMFLIDNGLRSATDPTWGGWGGRFATTSTGWIDTTDQRPDTGVKDDSYALTRWFPDLQQDFAARVRWGVTPCYSGANHNPTASIRGRLDQYVRAGSTITLRATASDPDGDAVNYAWWQYQDAGTYPGKVGLSRTDTSAVRVQVPRNAKRGQTIHIILTVSDGGTPTLKHYQRVVLHVR